TGSPRAQANLWLAVRLTGGFVALMWAVFLFDLLTGLDLGRFGLRPRDPAGLIGLLTTPLLHAHLGHIASNTLPLLVGGTALLFLYPNSALRVLPVLYLGSAAFAWIFARANLHIGASGLVYGILAFVFVSGILKRDLRSVGVSLLIWFLYGSMVWGVLPLDAGTSWELHASGMLMGVVMAFMFRRHDLPPVRRYDWELEDEPESDFEDDQSNGGHDRRWP